MQLFIHHCFQYITFSSIVISCCLFIDLYISDSGCFLCFFKKNLYIPSIQAPFHMWISLFFRISLSYSLQSPSELWSEAVRSSLPSPSIHPFISHLPTALPSGQTSLHPPPLHLNLSPCYLWEYADGANPGKDGIYLSYTGVKSRDWNGKGMCTQRGGGSAHPVNHKAVICPKKQSHSSKEEEK